jgi:hypothetical protein|tara:strand:+ start:3685 stop:4908 length:1224 start_codon:yes stop_codon:yes gene_type:complete
MANGWGQGTWGAVGWGGIGNTSFAVTGVAGTTAVGNEGVGGTSTVVETGLQATGAVGTANASSIHIITPTGVVGTTAVGNVLPKIPITAVVTGVSATTGFMTNWGHGTWGAGVWGGGVFADVGQVIPAATNVASGLVQTPTILGACNFSVTGVAGTTAVGNEVVDAQMKFTATGLQATGAVGNEGVTGTSVVVETGLSATVLISGYESSTVTKTVTVVSTGSGNKYFIDGVQQATQELFEGNTYRFDQSDSSNNGHPLRFSTTSNGTHGGGSLYSTGVTTNGTPGSSGAYTEITVATNTPTLYYYCSVHSGMGGQANTPIIYTIKTTTGAPVTNVVGTTALGSESVTGSAEIAVTLNGLSISAGTLALTGTSVLSLTGVTGTGSTGEEQVYSLIKPDQLANWIERVA